MKVMIGIFIIVIGLAGIFYAITEYNNIQEMKGSLEYKTAQTTDNLALNYLGIERENMLAKNIKSRENTNLFVLILGSVFVLFGAGIAIKQLIR